uniref:Uncharacterized protein n=1 Tax=Solanum tuberosum TaxID=4113 RepID=M1DLD0_SOLTU
MRHRLIEQWLMKPKSIVQSNEGLRTRQGHYIVKRREKVGKAEEKKGWSSQKSLGDSLSELLARQKIQRVGLTKVQFGDAPNGMASSIQLA